MWLLISLGTTALWIWGLYAWRGSTSWKGSMKVDGCQANSVSNKGKLQSVTVGCRTTARVEFELKQETWFDRWAKGVGLAAEREIGDRRFDDALYLVADDPQVATILRNDQELAALLLDGFSAGQPGVADVKRIVCRGGWLRVEITTKADADAAERIAADFAPGVREAARVLGEAATGVNRPDRLWKQRALLVAIAGGLAFNAALQGIRIGIVRLPATLDDGALWMQAVPLGVVLLAVLVVATLKFFGGTSRAHLVLAEVLLVGGCGAIGSCVVALRDLNIELDSSAPTVHASSVVEKNAHRGRKGGTTYTLVLREWSGSDGDQSIKVDSSTYNAYLMHEPVAVTMREGLLGLAWLESFDHAPR